MNPVKVKKKNKPFSHFLVSSSKKIHGWFDWGRRECTQERFLLNPYNGCGVGCFYCYTRALPGYFREFHHEGKIFVFDNFAENVSRQLDKIDIGFCGYLSPVTDPFQKINDYYHLSEKLVEVFIKRNLPIEFVTKERVPQEVIELIKGQPHSFGQVSITTLDSKLNRFLSSGASPEGLLDNLYRMGQKDIYAVCRVDPILPFINDDRESLQKILIEAKKRGAKHIISSVLDIPPRLKNFIFSRISRLFGSELVNKYKFLYKEKIGYWHADIDYRKEIFDFLKKQADDLGLTFSVCMEYEKKNGRIRGLNREFLSTINCEGMNTPVYKRRGNKFYPQQGCLGNCLNCTNAVCGIEELAYGKTGAPLPLKYSDYRKFSKKLGS